jgi:hypothetical protein
MSWLAILLALFMLGLTGAPASESERVGVHYRPEWHQYDFHRAREQYHFRWLCTGVGAGKTYAAVMECLILAADVNAGCPGLIVVPDFATYHDVIKPLIQDLWPEDIYDFRTVGNRPAIEVRTPKGVSWIYVRSAHNRQNVDKINGLTVAWIYMEEAGRFKCGSLAWKYSLERLRHPAPYNGIFIAGSPRPGWLPRAFEVQDGLPPEALQKGYSPMPDYYVRQAKTEWNTHNPGHYSARMRAVFAGDFARQELDGAIVQASGLIYADFAKGLHVIPHALAKELYERTVKNRKTGALDWGWTAPGGGLWGGWCEDGGTMVVLGEWYKTKCQVEQQGAEVKTASPDGTPFWGDPSEPENIDKLRRGWTWNGTRYSMDARAANNAWQAGTDEVRNLLHRRSNVKHIGLSRPDEPIYGAPRLYISDRCVNLVRELREYRDANDPEDEVEPKEGETVGDDHLIDCLRYMVYSSKRAAKPGTGRVAGL